MTTSHIAIPSDLRETLPASLDLSRCEITTYGALCADHDVTDDCVLTIPADTLVVIEPGWIASDGTAEVEYSAASDGEHAAEAYVADGDWGDRSTRTDWISVYAWRRGWALLPPDGDDEAEAIELTIDREWHSVEIAPDEPDCTDGHEHDWRAPYSVLGGLRENPGVQGHGGGVVITEVCAHCGTYRVTDTWAQRSDTGEQGLRGVEYRDADDASRAWVKARGQS